MQPIRMKVVSRYIGEEGARRAGDIVAVTERRAEQLERAGVAVREDVAAKKPVSPVSGPAGRSQSSPAAPALPPPTPVTSPSGGGAPSGSTTPTVSPLGATSSTLATGDGGTPTKRGRGRPPKARS